MKGKREFRVNKNPIWKNWRVIAVVALFGAALIYSLRFSNSNTGFSVPPTPADGSIQPFDLPLDDPTGYWTLERMKSAVPAPLPECSIKLFSEYCD